MASSDLISYNVSSPNFDIDYVIRYNVANSTKYQAELEFTNLIDALLDGGLMTEVRYGGPGFILIFVRLASLQNLEKRVFRSRLSVWLYDVQNEISLQSIKKNLQEVPISEAERLRTLYLLITSSKADGGIGITPNIGDWKNVDSIFPLHNNEFNKELVRKLNSKYILDAKTLTEIKDHFGERIALYFAFLQSYFMFLTFPASIGLLAWVFLGHYSPIFAGLNTLWCIVFVEFWKKQEKHLASQWKSNDDSTISYRYPELENMYSLNDSLTGKRVRKLSPLKRLLRQILLIPFVITATITLGGLIATCFAIEIFITEVYSGHFKRYMVLLPTIILSTMMPVVSALLKKSALKLTDFENYETRSSYETSIVQKIFVLNFISSYLPIFLTAFVYVPFGQVLVPHLNIFNLIFKYSSYTNNQNFSQENVFQINPDRLKSQVIYFTVTAQILNFGLEVIFPYIRRKLFSKVKNVKLGGSMKYNYANTEPVNDSSEFSFLAQVREEAEMKKYDVTTDFREMIVQFGYLSLFSVVWPLTAFSFLINNWIEIRSDAIKITMETQRPIPWQTFSIRPWINALGFLSWLGSFTTAALVYLFSGNAIGPGGTPDNIKGWRLLLVVFISEHIYLATKFVVKKVISNLHNFERRIEESEKLKTRKFSFEKIINENTIGNLSSQTIYNGVKTSEGVERDNILNHKAEDGKQIGHQFWQCKFNTTEIIELGKNYISMAKSRESKKELFELQIVIFMCTENLQSNSSYIILDVRRFLENWQDAIDENGLTFWFGFKSGSHLHQFGNLECIVQTWSNHVGASVYVHYFKNIDAYRIGQIYNNDVALQVKQAVFILKRDPVTSTSTQHISETITSTSPSIKPSFDKLKLRSLNTERLASNPHAYCSQHIRKPRNAWIIFRQETMVKFRDQIGHLHTSEQSKVISKMWKKTPKHIKDLYTSRAHKEKADLLEQYPNYRVQPRKSSEIRKRIRNKYPVSLTVEDLNEWVQTQSAFSQNSCSIKRSPNSSGFFNSDAEKLGTRQVQSNNDQHILSEKNSCSQFFAQRENN